MTERQGRVGSEGGESRTPISLKNGIALLDPRPIARGAFGEIYTGRIANPIALLAERVVWGEENPHWLGLDDIPYVEPDPEALQKGNWLPVPIIEPAQKKRVYEAAARLWRDYQERRRQDPARAGEEFRDLLGVLDPLLLQDTVIAVKVLVPPTGGDPDVDQRIMEDSIRRFIRENDILSSLRHPGIVRRFGLVRDPRMGWCLLLEYIEGDTLEEHLRRYEGRGLPLPVAVQRIRDITEALAYVHQHGIIHRDLKPSNIMIREDDGRAVIMDFGIGKWVAENQTQQLTIAGSRIGTPRYMAPEQVVPDGVVTMATDVYQLCTVFFELVTGTAAYEGMNQTEIYHRLSDPSQSHPVYVADRLPTISRELEALIEVGRDKDPSRRWTIEEFQEKLGRIIAEERYEDARRWEPADPEEIRRSLRHTRIRRKESHWEEHLLETRLHYVNLQKQIEEARLLFQKKAYLEARAALTEVSREVAPLPPRYEILKNEIQILERELELVLASRDAEQILTLAEQDFAAQKFPEAGVRLAAAAQRLSLLPPASFADLHERYRNLNERYESQYRSFVDLFNTLRKSFIVKIQQRCDELREQAEGGNPINPTAIRDLLQQVTLAENNLAIIRRDKIGPAAYDRARKDLQDQRTALEALLGTRPPTPPPEGNR